MVTYTAVDPAGGVHRRASHRVYTHAVLVGPDPHGGVHSGWGTWGFCGRYDLAVKTAAKARVAWPGVPVVIVPAEADCKFCAPDEPCALHVAGGLS